jgi:hypothetical protein
MRQMHEPEFRVFVNWGELCHAPEIRPWAPLNQLPATSPKWCLTGLIFEGDHPSFLGNGYRLDL